MIDFSVDTDKCVGCGDCALDCLNGVIGMDNGVPFIREENEDLCIGCQHCLAVCATGALSIFGRDPADSLSLDGAFPAPGQIDLLFQSRRSIRRYSKEGVDPALIQHLLELVSVHAPTAVNRQQTLLTVVDTPEAMDRFRERATKAALKAFHEGGLPKGLERIGKYLRGCERGEDVIFRNAPHLLVASAPKDALAPMPDCHIAMTYFELLAVGHGLGTVWNGIARYVIDLIAPDLRELLGIPGDHIIACVMSFGTPAVKYHRAVQRAGGGIQRATI